jgi:HPt (histidine-containing phosphotransfer) domain-containing protein
MIECLAKPLDPNNLERLLDRVAAKARELGPRAASSIQAPRIGIVENAEHAEIGNSDAPLIGESSLLARLGEDENFMRELLAIFVDEWPGRLEAFKSAAADRDVEALQKLGHALKGSSLSLCAEPLGISAGALEASCIAAKRSGLASPAAFSSIQAPLENLNVLLERTAEAAKAILNQHGA